MYQMRPQQTVVKTYKNPKDFQKDQKRMARQGWMVAHMVDHQRGRSLAGKLLVPGGMFTKPPAQIVVTYAR